MNGKVSVFVIFVIIHLHDCTFKECELAFDSSIIFILAVIKISNNGKISTGNM